MLLCLSNIGNRCNFSHRFDVRRSTVVHLHRFGVGIHLLADIESESIRFALFEADTRRNEPVVAGRLNAIGVAHTLPVFVVVPGFAVVIIINYTIETGGVSRIERLAIGHTEIGNDHSIRLRRHAASVGGNCRNNVGIESRNGESFAKRSSRLRLGNNHVAGHTHHFVRNRTANSAAFGTTLWRRPGQICFIFGCGKFQTFDFRRHIIANKERFTCSLTHTGAVFHLDFHGVQTASNVVGRRSYAFAGKTIDQVDDIIVDGNFHHQRLRSIKRITRSRHSRQNKRERSLSSALNHIDRQTGNRGRRTCRSAVGDAESYDFLVVGNICNFGCCSGRCIYFV